MNSIMAHRGPDGEGVYEQPQAALALGHRRLAIIDLSEDAKQPMATPNGLRALSFNGEIYNYRELRADLEKEGCQFRSASDTEVLLLGLANYGVRFLDMLNGIFAFAFYDDTTRRLMLARDHAGVKPLYYCVPRPGVLVFASEIKALFAYEHTPREPDFLAIQEHLARSHASGPRTAFKGIYRLPPGHYLEWDLDLRNCKIAPFWQPHEATPPSGSYKDAVAALRESVLASARRQLVSDVPVGIFLSGGLDSSLIGASAVRSYDGTLESYTISYPPSENILDDFPQDSPFARRFAEITRLNHIEVEITPDVRELLPRLLWHMDEPSADPAIIAAYLISRLAKQRGTSVLLSGQGADELFGGYPRYQAMAITKWSSQVPTAAKAMVRGLAGVIPTSIEGPIGGRLRRGSRVLRSFGLRPQERFMAYCSSTADEDISTVLSPEVSSQIGGRPSAEYSLSLMDESKLPYGNQFLYRDLVDYLPNHNLLYTDKMAMAAGVEARVPLLDASLLKTVPMMSYSWKVSRLRTKRILREAAKGLVPDWIINRSKAGFGAPYRKWLRYDLAPLWEDLSLDAVVRRRGWFNTKALSRIRLESQDGRKDTYMLQWAIMTVELWAQQFFDKDPTVN